MSDKSAPDGGQAPKALNRGMTFGRTSSSGQQSSSFWMGWVVPKIVLPVAAITLIVAVALSAVNSSLAANLSEWEALRPLVVLGQNQHFREFVAPLLALYCVYVFSNYLAFAAGEHMLDSFMLDETTAIFMQGLVKYVSLAFAGSIILRAFGVQTAGLEMLLGSGGVALAFASQQVLKNFAAGCMILLLRPFQVGDKIQTGAVEGTVISVGLLESVILTNSGVRIWYDNGSIKENFLSNKSQHGMRRVDAQISVSIKAEVAATRAALELAIQPFQELWKQEHKPGEESKSTQGRVSSTEGQGGEEEESPDVSVRDAILHQYPGLLSMLAGKLAGKLTQGGWKVAASSVKVAQAGPACISCGGANDRGIAWCAHVWAPAKDYDSVAGQVQEAMVRTLQEQGLEVAVLGHRAL